ncbi:hypothetical protein LPUS_10560 [Lasallia pustulata]|uniref:DUF7905 domain-containing protein n=1 Tax=Lasallia pustulata TaxID=136370 RepID=A0A1W5DA86_9LECA|nr:hypothetical protein LPUS_10560 [Lasallia pustulata]
MALEEIGVRTKSFIRPPKHVADCTLLIWGTMEQAYAAKRELEKWVRRAEGDTVVVNRFKDMPKIMSYTDKMRREHDRKMQAEALRQKYRKAPKDGVAFATMGSFLWPPEEDFRPDELLGPSYEAFDPIRTYCECYITFESRTSLFKVMSDKPQAVQDALRRIGFAVCEFTTRKGRPMEIYLVEPPTLMMARANVMLRPMATHDIGANADRADQSRVPVVPILIGTPLPQLELTQWAEKRPALLLANEKRIRSAILDCISSMRFYRGRVCMRVHFGIFALTQYRQPGKESSIPYEQFSKDMGWPETKGRLIEDLRATKDGEDLITRCRLATNIFKPADVLVPTLENVAPVYTAVFEFRHQDTGNVKLEVGMSKGFGTDGHYERSHTQWTRIEKSDPTRPSDETASPPLEVSMVRLHRCVVVENYETEALLNGDSGISWRLQISTENCVSESRITPAMKEFVESIQFEEPLTGVEAAARKPQMFKYMAKLPVRNFVQKTTWQYRLKKENAYIFEITRYDSFTESRSNAMAEDPSKVMRTRWGASLYNTAWDSTFSENASLILGEMAKWDPRLETFFPWSMSIGISEANAGFRDFLQKVDAVAEALDESGMGGPLRSCGGVGDEEVGRTLPA